MDFSTAEEQTSGDIIPHRTPVKVRMKIRPGGYNDESKGWTGGYATRSDKTGAVYLDAEYTVVGGKFNKRKVWSLIGLHSVKGDKWEMMGRSFIRAALESAHGIKAEDASEKAMNARRITGFADLDGLEFCAMVEVEKAEPGSGYDDKNKIQNVIGVSHKDYAGLMEGAGADAPAATTAPAATSGGEKPAWA
jgi:hypothetical protein